MFQRICFISCDKNLKISSQLIYITGLGHIYISRQSYVHKLQENGTLQHNQVNILYSDKTALEFSVIALPHAVRQLDRSAEAWKSRATRQFCS
jgi:hypothetical protein